MNSEITDVARGLKCGRLAAYGLNPIGLASHGSVVAVSRASRSSCFNRYARATPLTPPPERKRKSRLDQHVLHVCMAIASCAFRSGDMGTGDLGTWGPGDSSGPPALPALPARPATCP